MVLKEIGMFLKGYIMMQSAPVPPMYLLLNVLALVFVFVSVTERGGPEQKWLEV